MKCSCSSYNALPLLFYSISDKRDKLSNDSALPCHYKPSHQMSTDNLKKRRKQQTTSGFTKTWSDDQPIDIDDEPKVRVVDNSIDKCIL